MPNPTQQVKAAGGQSAGQPAVEQQFSNSDTEVAGGGPTLIVITLHGDSFGPFISLHMPERLLWNFIGFRRRI